MVCRILSLMIYTCYANNEHIENHEKFLDQLHKILIATRQYHRNIALRDESDPEQEEQERDPIGAMLRWNPFMLFIELMI